MSLNICLLSQTLRLCILFVFAVYITRKCIGPRSISYEIIKAIFCIHGSINVIHLLQEMHTFMYVKKKNATFKSVICFLE